MNPIMNMLGNNNVMIQAMNAMMRGENPKSFLINLAKNNPKLQGLDFSNLENTARKMCKDSGVNVEEAKSQIVKQVNNQKFV